MSFKDVMFWPFSEKQVMGSEPSIKSKSFNDPLKEQVATPLSNYLKNEIGKGLPEYPGKLSHDFGSEFGGEGLNRYKEFLALSPEKFFEEKVATPVMNRFREEQLPLIRESFAGGLRGSGRFRSEEDAARNVATRLSEVGGLLVPDIYGKQIGVSEKYKAGKDSDYQRSYSAWMKTLPGFNPAIAQALQFLNSSTSTGTEYATALDPGSDGMIGELLKLAAFAAGSAGGGA